MADTRASSAPAWNKGDGADKAFLELLGSEKILDEKKEKRAEARAKKAAEAKKAMEEAEAQAAHDGGVEPVKERRQERIVFLGNDLQGTASAVPFSFNHSYMSCCVSAVILPASLTIHKLLLMGFTRHRSALLSAPERCWCSSLSATCGG